MLGNFGLSVCALLRRHKPYVMRIAAVETILLFWPTVQCLSLGHMCHLLAAKHTKTHFYLHASSSVSLRFFCVNCTFHYILFVLHFSRFCFVYLLGLWNRNNNYWPGILFAMDPFDMFYSNLFALFTNGALVRAQNQLIYFICARFFV